MPTEYLLSPQTTNKYIREEMTRLLHTNHIYELDSHGWIDADTYDPVLIGHAMNQLDSLSWRFFDAAMNSPSPPQLEQWEKFLMISGGDFEGLMEAARLSMGFMLFQDALVNEDTTASDSFFPVHLMSAMMLLGSASDRLRDFFIAAVFHKTAEKYQTGKYKGQKRSWYTTSFNEARECLGNRPELPAASVTKLPDLAGQIHGFRKMRNKTVHVIATELGRQKQRLVDDPPSAHADEFNWVITDEILDTYSMEVETEHQNRISHPMDWYRLLIETSNHVFIIENTLRRGTWHA
jgi:hypothetical protein